MTCRRFRCPDCSDLLIHQSYRGPHESSSGHGQHIHDHMPNTFYEMDNDHTLYKRSTNVLRHIEFKYAHQAISAGQATMLPLLARAYGFLERRGVIAQTSGVYVAWWDPPFDSEPAIVHRIRPRGAPESMLLRGDPLTRLMCGEVL